ncbi:MAG: glycosyltransferase [Candidatus Sericytochromatia bacterium]
MSPVLPQAGPGPELRTNTALPCVTLIGAPPDIQPVYAACDIAIAPLSFGGGSRLKILEAMAMGRPVVAMAVADHGMGLDHGKHIRLASSARAFAREIAWLLSHPEARVAQVQAARQHVLSQFSWDELGRQLLDLVQQTVTGHTRLNSGSCR